MAASSDLLPLFPLGHVLMPGCPLPLRVFEPRYRRLLADVTGEDGPRRFGVPTLLAGPEVDSGFDDAAPRLADIGTVAEILEMHPQPDGTVNLLTGGSSRFRIERIVETTAPYLEAEVSYLDELTGQLPEALPDQARALAVEYKRLIGVANGEEDDPRQQYPTDPILLSYRLATESPLSQHDHQDLLEDDTATSRLLRVQRVLRREVVLLRRTRSIAVSPAVLRAVLGPN
ncbi:MAG: LON peptidase substrate-binding domain-containing protein [Jatrophihabitantaceae bacterium]